MNYRPLGSFRATRPRVRDLGERMASLAHESSNGRSPSRDIAPDHGVLLARKTVCESGVGAWAVEL
jgi:hypothetical protein